jgi:uncharacterized protein YndB with AHSA1/START domain
MFAVDFRATIHRPIDAVFDRLVAIDDYAEWLPESRIFLDCRTTSPEPVRAGTTFVDETRIGRFQGEVEEMERPRRVIFHNHLSLWGITLMESWPGYELEPTEDGKGTRVRHFGKGRARGLFKVMEPYMARRAQEERGRTLHFLKESLEDEVTALPPDPGSDPGSR